MAQQIGEKVAVTKQEKPGNGGAGTGELGRKEAVDWRDVDTLIPVGANNAKVIKQRYRVIRVVNPGHGHFVYFPCRRQSKGGCKFMMRWAKQGGLLQQHGQHNHALMAPAKKRVEWQDVDTLLPVGRVKMEEIKQRYGVLYLAGRAWNNFTYLPCRRHQHGRCKFIMRWAKRGGLLQQHGQHNHAVKKQGQDEEVPPTMKQEEEDGTGTGPEGDEEEVHIDKYLQRDYKCLGRMVLEGEEKPGKECGPVHTIQGEEEDIGMDMEEGTSQATRKKKKRGTLFYRYPQKEVPVPMKKEEPGAEEAEEADEEEALLQAPPPPQMPRIAIVVPQWLLQPHQPMEVGQPAKMLLRERKKRIDYGE